MATGGHYITMQPSASITQCIYDVCIAFELFLQLKQTCNSQSSHSRQQN